MNSPSADHLDVLGEQLGGINLDPAAAESDGYLEPAEASPAHLEQGVEPSSYVSQDEQALSHLEQQLQLNESQAAAVRWLTDQLDGEQLGDINLDPATIGPVSLVPPRDVCSCGAPVDHAISRHLCPACQAERDAEFAREWAMKERYEARKKAGLCLVCGERPLTDNTGSCRECRGG